MFDHDGEFWMTFKDFQSYFTRVEICNLGPEYTPESRDGHMGKSWEMSSFEAEWIRNSTAGGCRNFISSFALNPQFIVTLSDSDEGDNDGKCTVIVALMQKNRRSKRQHGVDFLSIGFAVYYVSSKFNFFK